MNDTRPTPTPTTRALLHRLRGATRAYLEIIEEAKAQLAEAPEVTDVHDQLVDALRDHGPMGTPRSLAGAIEDAIWRLGEPGELRG
jgi:hypothetical protein